MPSHYADWYQASRTAYLGGDGRIGLVSQQAGWDTTEESPSTSFQKLFADANLRRTARNIIHSALGQYLVVDATNMGRLRLRLSEEEPPSEDFEQSLGPTTRNFMDKAQLVEESSDGVKAFTGIIVELIAGDPEIILMDEPEAFLHPPLAQSLGREIARLAKLNRKKVFVATHSASFLMGCLQENEQINIVRLTYKREVATARLLASSGVKDLMKDPLLRSSNVLSGLFHEAVVVTEADADRAFYQEVNYRLNSGSRSKGLSDCLFVNAQNKQTIQRIIKPLRKLGIPAAGIVDIDVIKSKSDSLSPLLDSISVPEQLRRSLGQLRGDVHQSFDEANLDMKLAGIQGLTNGAKRAAEAFIEQLASYGLFVVPCGELESWLAHLNIEGKKKDWIVKMLERIGAPESDSSFVPTGEDDVWRFVQEIADWCNDPLRKGIPT